MIRFTIFREGFVNKHGNIISEMPLDWFQSRSEALQGLPYFPGNCFILPEILKNDIWSKTDGEKIYLENINDY
jgi:hypothetical protein